MQNSFKFRVWLEEENKMISPEDENADCIFAYNQYGDLLKFVSNIDGNNVRLFMERTKQ